MKKLLRGLILTVTLLNWSLQGFTQDPLKGNGNKKLPAGEFQLNPGTVYQSAPFDQSSSAIAFNGTVYLVVWTDSRTTLDNDIYGVRLDANGTQLDSAGILICGAPHSQRNPAVVSNGDIFMVVWEDERESAQSGTDIYGTRVSGEGIILDQPGIKISDAQDAQTLPAVGTAEGNFFAVWVDHRSGTNNDIYGSFISVNGAVANPSGLEICTQGGWQSSPDVSYDGSRYFIVWSDQRGFSKDIYGVFLKTDGTLSQQNGAGIVTLFNNQENPSITWNGNVYFLAYEENQSGVNTQIHGGRVNASGVMLDVNSIEIAAYTGFDYCKDPNVTSMDSDFLVDFTLSHGDFAISYSVIAKRIGFDGTILDPDGLAVSGNSLFTDPKPAAAFNGTSALVAWTDDRNVSLDIYGNRITPAGNMLDPGGVCISKGFNEQVTADISYDGTNYLAVWCDTRGGTVLNIFASRIFDNGTILDPGAVQVSFGETDCLNPSVSFNGTDYLIVYESAGDIYGARMSTQGTVVGGPYPICVNTAYQGSPVVASDSAGWLVVWHDYRNTTGESNSDIFGTLVNANGAVQQPDGIAISTATGDQANPAITFAANQYVVVWDDARSGGPNIYATRVSADGTVQNAEGVGLAVNNAVAMLYPSVASDGTNYLACWHGGTPGAYDIYGVRFDQSLNVLDAQPIVLSNALRDQFSTSLAWNGEVYMAVWMDQTALTNFRISMAKINPDGTIAETGVLSELEGNEMDPAVVHGPLKQFFTSFSAFMATIDDKPVNALRAMGFLLGQGQGPGIIEHDDGIISRFDVYPNPANDRITVEYELAKKSNVDLSLYTIDGRLVSILSTGKSVSGKGHENYTLGVLPEGVYLLEMKAGNSVLTRKLQVVH